MKMARLIFFIILIAILLAVATGSALRHKRGTEVKTTANASNEHDLEKRSDTAGAAPPATTAAPLAKENSRGNKGESGASAGTGTKPANEPSLPTTNATVSELTTDKKFFDSQSALNRMARSNFHHLKSYYPFFDEPEQDTEFTEIEESLPLLNVGREYMHPYVSIAGVDPFAYQHRFTFRDAEPNKGTEAPNSSKDNNHKNGGDVTAVKDASGSGGHSDSGGSGGSAKGNTGNNSNANDKPTPKESNNDDNKDNSKDTKHGYKRRFNKYPYDNGFRNGLTLLTDNRKPYRLPRLQNPRVQVQYKQQYKPQKLSADNFNSKMKPLENILNFANILLYKVGGAGGLVLPLIIHVRLNPRVDAMALTRGRILEDFGRFLILRPCKPKIPPCPPKLPPCRPKFPPLPPRPLPCPPKSPPCQQKYPTCGQMNPVHPIYPKQFIPFKNIKKFEAKAPLDRDQKFISPKQSIQWNGESESAEMQEPLQQEQDPIRPEQPLHLNFQKSKRVSAQSALKQNQDSINTKQAYQWNGAKSKRVLMKEPLTLAQLKFRQNVKNRSRANKRANKRNENALPHSSLISNAPKSEDDFEDIGSTDYVYNSMDTAPMTRGVGRLESKALQSTDVGSPVFIEAPVAESNETPSKLFGNAIDMILSNDEDKEDDEFELRCPVHYEKKSVADGDTCGGNAKEGVVEVCSCRLFKKKHT